MSNESPFVYPFSFSCFAQDASTWPSPGPWPSTALGVASVAAQDIITNSASDQLPISSIPPYQIQPPPVFVSHLPSNDLTLPSSGPPGSDANQPAENPKNPGPGDPECITLGGVKRRVELLLMGPDHPPPSAHQPRVRKQRQQQHYQQQHQQHQQQEQAGYGQTAGPSNVNHPTSTTTTNHGRASSLKHHLRVGDGDFVSRDQLRDILRKGCDIPVETYFCACELDSGKILVVSNRPDLLYGYQDFFRLHGFEKAARNHNNEQQTSTSSSSSSRKQQETRGEKKAQPAAGGNPGWLKMEG